MAIIQHTRARVCRIKTLLFGKSCGLRVVLKVVHAGEKNYVAP